MTQEEPRKPSPEPLTRIGSYRIVRPLGTGGMSSVFLAAHVESGHEVALKVLPRILARNTTLLQRFLREAKIAESLEHPNIVAIYDRGSEQGRYYLVLEYVAGGDLHDWIRTHGPLPVDQTVAVLKGVVRGLEHAASRGLIHRDVKPANILLTDPTSAKVADLGLAVQMEEDDERVTRDGTTVGTVDYMSPEQARDSRATTIQSDMYSLGCTLYHMLTGSPPFTGAGVPEKLKAHASQKPPRIRVARPDVPEELAAILGRLLAKRAEGRFADYAELQEALDRVPSVGEQAGQGPQIALLDDDDQVEPPPKAAAPGGAIRYAVIDEADSDGDFLPDDAPASRPTIEAAMRSSASNIRKPPSATQRRAEEPARGSKSHPELNLAELAALDADASSVPAGRRPARVTAAPPSPTPLDLDDVFPVPMAPRSVARSSGSDDELRVWIVRGLLIGLALALLVLAAHSLIREYNKPPPVAPREPEAYADDAFTDRGHGPAVQGMVWRGPGAWLACAMRPAQAVTPLPSALS